MQDSSSHICHLIRYNAWCILVLLSALMATICFLHVHMWFQARCETGLAEKSKPHLETYVCMQCVFAFLCWVWLCCACPFSFYFSAAPSSTQLPLQLTVQILVVVALCNPPLWRQLIEAWLWPGGWSTFVGRKSMCWLLHIGLRCGGWIYSPHV